MWTPTTRRQHSRAGLRYETDLTDAEWAVIAPLMPNPAPCGRGKCPIFFLYKGIDRFLALSGFPFLL